MTENDEYNNWLAAIRANPGDRVVKLTFIDWCQEHAEFVRDKLHVVMRENPLLTLYGIFDDVPEPGHPDCPRFHYERAALADALVPFVAALAWVASRKRRKRLDWTRDSFRQARTAGVELKGYIDGPQGGTLIAAALCFGHNHEPVQYECAVLTIGERLPHPDKPKRNRAPRWKPGYAWMEHAGLDWREVVGKR